ncbi:unnamed protein product [Pieris macdunnoughi]|uniref:Uncharacterized protein n=1 Tax=Pieris macdunnoughi TaxID=345717 RepID=A0A821XQ45_9NEOP|nr:unnamed protein product [Pieris macdunnoughi]
MECIQDFVARLMALQASSTSVSYSPRVIATPDSKGKNRAFVRWALASSSSFHLSGLDRETGVCPLPVSESSVTPQSIHQYLTRLRLRVEPLCRAAALTNAILYQTHHPKVA